eukprot:TRINITY_DN648_c0_g1_i1.p1 TRINITY_DN648_c0_g1~~TRINITY_DN648_c0_g1_i1.p1  ORF type:complete len:264 (-),score=73.36 TRINITY_DN648_c0_g1_i1:209-1000(-)
MIQKQSTLHLVLRIRAQGEQAEFLGLAPGRGDDGSMSLDNLVNLQTCEALLAQSKSVPDVSIKEDLRKLARCDDVMIIEKAFEDGDIFRLRCSNEFQAWGERLIVEAIRCARECRLQFGQIKLEMLGLEDELLELVRSVLRSQFEIEEQEGGIHLETVIFHDGATCLFEDEFVMSYAPNNWLMDQSSRALPEHKDFCDLTINICLGDKFEGGEIEFINHEESSVFTYEHKPGHAVMHSGEILHKVKPTKIGDRFNLLVFVHNK